MYVELSRTRKKCCFIDSLIFFLIADLKGIFITFCGTCCIVTNGIIFVIWAVIGQWCSQVSGIIVHDGDSNSSKICQVKKQSSRRKIKYQITQTSPPVSTVSLFLSCPKNLLNANKNSQIELKIFMQYTSPNAQNQIQFFSHSCLRQTKILKSRSGWQVSDGCTLWCKMASRHSGWQVESQ